MAATIPVDSTALIKAVLASPDLTLLVTGLIETAVGTTLKKSQDVIAGVVTQVDAVATQLGALETTVQTLSKRTSTSGPILRELPTAEAITADSRIAALDEIIKNTTDPTMRQALQRQRAQYAIAAVQAAGGNRIG